MQVDTKDEIAQVFLALLDDENTRLELISKASEIVQRQQGAAQRIVAHLEDKHYLPTA